MLLHQLVAAALVIATWNMGNAGDQVVQRDATRIVSRADVVVVQEAGDRQRILDRLDARPGIAVYRGDGRPGAARTAIIWHTHRLHRRAASTIPVVPRTYVGARGTGPARLGPKVLNRVRLFDLEQHRPVTVAAMHVVPSVYLEIRRQLAIRQIAAARELALRVHGATVIPGDWNMGPTHPLLRPLRRTTRSCDPPPGQLVTHGRGWTPDQQHYRPGPGRLHVVDVRRGRSSSDHRPLYCTYRWRR